MTRITTVVLIFLMLAVSSCQHQKYKVLFVGNNITKHKPKPEIGWYGNWGMAASDSTKDYVHILMDSIRSIKSNASYEIEIANQFERTLKIPPKNPKKFDLVIINLGENIDDSVAANNPDFVAIYKEFIDRYEGQVVIVPSFWNKPNVNKKIEEASEGKIFVDFSNITKGNTALGKFKKPGVAAHPSDKGMLEISSRIWRKVKPVLE